MTIVEGWLSGFLTGLTIGALIIFLWIYSAKPERRER
jgi:hypothetical protein